MSAMNVTILMGNLTKAPELRHTNGGTAVCEFRIGVNEVFTNRDGEKAEQTLFIDVQSWEKQAESCAKYLEKGSLVVVEGRLKLDQWTSEDGQKHSKIFVRAQRVQFVGRGRGPGDREGTDEADPVEPF